MVLLYSSHGGESLRTDIGGLRWYAIIRHTKALYVSNFDLAAGLVVDRTSLIHRKRSPFPKGKAYKLPFTELNNG